VVDRSADQVERQDATAANSNAPVGNRRIGTERGRTSAGRRRPTGALPGFQLRLRRTKTAYKVDKISESFSAKRKTFDRVGLVNHQQS